MRLVNKSTFALELFHDDKVPPYVVFSHRWGNDETSLQQFPQETQLPTDKWSAGTAKIMGLCNYIKDRPEQYIWADTCCIDKTSSAETQESINSMFRWYQEASLCVVYVEDVKARPQDPKRTKKDVARSARRSGGWTLQELLAPKAEIFVDTNWRPIGSRDDLAADIESITGIAAHYMGNFRAIVRAPVAERMSWLAHRKTTKAEDLAYCMLGIFDINMTMLYGEGGSKAFLRLQRKILRETSDESIFLWTYNGYTDDERIDIIDLSRSSILAPHPACFAGFGGFRLDTYLLRDPPRVTGRGVEMELFCPRSAIAHDKMEIPLNCVRVANVEEGKEGHLGRQRAFLQLQRVEDEEFTSASAAHTVWKRIERGEIRCLEDRQYLYPPSDQEEWRDQRRAFEVEAQRNAPKIGGISVGQPRFNPPAQMAVMNYSNEGVRRKVFVRWTGCSWARI